MARAVTSRQTGTKAQRMQIMMPAPLAKRLRDRVPARGRSAYIARAVEQAIDADEQMKRQQLEPEGPIWGDEDYPYLNTAEDVREWVEAIRSGRDPEAELLAKYATRGIVTREDFAVWQAAWRRGEDGDEAVRRHQAKAKKAARSLTEGQRRSA